MESIKKYPLTSDYQTSVFHLDRCVLDTNLKGGIARKSKYGLELYSGGYSRVFPIVVNTNVYALRVWIANVDNAKKRYKEISKYLQQIKLPYFVDFEYVDRGLLVKGIEYPIIRMEWAKGKTLKLFIEENLNSPTILKACANKFLQMVKDLHTNEMSHGDLQDGNIIISNSNNDLQMKLIDYDSMFVPSLAGQPDLIVGLPTYQHPVRIQSSGINQANQHVDYFSELVIYLSLLAYAEKKNIWNDFMSSKADGLIFTKKDFQDPNNSKIFNLLDTLSDEIQYLSQALKNFCSKQRLDELQPLESVVGIQFSKTQNKSSIHNLISTIQKPLKSSSPKPPQQSMNLQNLFKQIKSIPKPIVNQKKIAPNTSNLQSFSNTSSPSKTQNFSGAFGATINTPIPAIASITPSDSPNTHKGTPPVSQGNTKLPVSTSFYYLFYVVIFTVMGTGIPHLLHLKGSIENKIILACLIKTFFYVFLITGVILSFKRIFKSSTPNILYTSAIITLTVITGTYLNLILFKKIHVIIETGFFYWIISIGIIIACNNYFYFQIQEIIYHSFIVLSGAFFGEACRNIMFKLFNTSFFGVYDGIFYGVFALFLAFFSLGLKQFQLYFFSVFIALGAIAGYTLKKLLIISFGEIVHIYGFTYCIFYLTIFLFLYIWYLLFKK